jgi:GNAT superfamily N-acetyltransferase
MEIRKANLNDMDLLMENRIEFVLSIRDLPDVAAYSLHTRAYFEKHLTDDTLLVYLAIEDGRIISSSLLSIYETIPISYLSGKTGLLLNMYTLEAYRRQGLASLLLSKIIDEARALGVVKIRLDYTDAGYPLYKKFGFVELDREMALNL